MPWEYHYHSDRACWRDAWAPKGTRRLCVTFIGRNYVNGLFDVSMMNSMFVANSIEEARKLADLDLIKQGYVLADERLNLFK